MKKGSLSIEDMSQMLTEQKKAARMLRRKKEDEYRRGQYDMLVRLGYLLSDISIKSVDWVKVDELIEQQRIIYDK